MNILTFDVEEWFHLLDHPDTRSETQWRHYESRFEKNFERILSIVEGVNARATFFCLGWIAERYPRLVSKITDLGHEVACHSSTHQLAYTQTPDEFRNDLRRAIDQIQSATGVRVDTYRVPGFSLTQDSLWLLEILAQEGIKVDCSVFPARRGHGGLPQFSHAGPCKISVPSGGLKELPLNVTSFLGNPIVFSGGGYFRILPYWWLDKCFSKSEYVMTYFHPRDFDPAQPRLRGLHPFRRFKSYVGLASAEKKLTRLLRSFAFVDVRTAVSMVNWSEVPVISLSSDNL